MILRLHDLPEREKLSLICLVADLLPFVLPQDDNLINKEGYRTYAMAMVLGVDSKAYPAMMVFYRPVNDMVFRGITMIGVGKSITQEQPISPTEIPEEVLHAVVRGGVVLLP